MENLCRWIYDHRDMFPVNLLFTLFALVIFEAFLELYHEGTLRKILEEDK